MVNFDGDVSPMCIEELKGGALIVFTEPSSEWFCKMVINLLTPRATTCWSSTREITGCLLWVVFLSPTPVQRGVLMSVQIKRMRRH